MIFDAAQLHPFTLGDIDDQQAFAREWRAEANGLGCHPELHDQARRLRRLEQNRRNQQRRRQDPNLRAAKQADDRRRYWADAEARRGKIARKAAENITLRDYREHARR